VKDIPFTPRPVTGSVPAVTPHPYEPHTEEAVAPDPGESVLTDIGGENFYYNLPRSRKGASDYSDPNPVDAEHIYIQLARNFPPEAIQWVKRARWIGPVWVPWDRVDTDDKDKWAASHQPGKVNEFARQMKAHDGHVAPSILVQEPHTHKAFIVDGHHRALAREKLGQKVLAYIGNIDPKDRPAAWETHTKQLHQGSDPANKAAKRPMVSKESVNYRPAEGKRHCGNCVMFHPGGTCDLVMGHIRPEDTCDRWEAK
jgi:hypothetical protein